MKKVLLIISLIFLTGAGCEIQQQTQQPIKNSETPFVNEIAQPPISEEITNINKGEEETFLVTSVVDGDTIKVNIAGKIETLRLIGIDTPETVDPRKVVQCFGKEASNKAKEWLLGKTVELEADPISGERDKYNRLLRYVKVKDGMFYNLEIIKQGYAHEYTYNNIPYKYQNDFKNAEKYARENKLGLWSDSTCSGDTTKPAITSVPTSTPTPTPPPTPTPTPAPTPSPTCNCSSNIYNCADFKTHAEAQALYECCGGVNNDIHQLDRDKDGSACETLP